MKLQKQTKQNRKKSIILLSIVVALLVGGGAYALYTINSSEDKNINNSETSNKTNDENGNVAESDKQSEDPKTDDSVKETNSDTPTPPKTDPSTNKRSVRIDGSSDISNNTVFIRGGVSNSVEYEGTCYALLTGPSGATIRKDTTLLQNPTTTDCKTIQIPLSELTKGNWKFTLNFNSDQATGVSQEYAFEVK